MSRVMWWLAFGAFVIGFAFAWTVFWRFVPSSLPPVETPVVHENGDERATSPCADVYGRFIGLDEEGQVAVFAGRPDGCRMLLAPALDYENVLPFQRADLEEGIVVYHDEELFQVLEGLILP